MSKVDILKFDVHIKGIRPILFNRFPDEDFDKGKPVRMKSQPTKEEQFEKSLYRMKNGKVYQPASHIVGSMINASKRFKLKGRLTFKEVIEGGVFVIPEQIPHVIQEPLEIDWRSVVNKNVGKGARVMCARGRLNKWELKFQLHCWDDRATGPILKEILQVAGAYLGVGAYRPRYGRFEVVSWKKVKN